MKKSTAIIVKKSLPMCEYYFKFMGDQLPCTGRAKIEIHIDLIEVCSENYMPGNDSAHDSAHEGNIRCHVLGGTLEWEEPDAIRVGDLLVGTQFLHQGELRQKVQSADLHKRDHSLVLNPSTGTVSWWHNRVLVTGT